MLFLLQDKEDVGDVLLVFGGLVVAIVRLQQEGVPTEEFLHGGMTEVLLQRGL